MSSSKVPPEFLNNFERWCRREVNAGRFNEIDVEEMRGLIRQDLKEGPDMLRQGLPSQTDDHQERFKLWYDWLAADLMISD